MSEQTKHKKPTKETDPKTPSIIQSSRTKSTISSLLLENQVAVAVPKKKNHFSSSVATFRGLGCAAGAPQVSVPAVIRTSADWETKKVRKKKLKKSKGGGIQAVAMGNGTMGCGVNSDVWCGPGIGFNTDAVADSSVDCVVARRAVSGRGKVDGEKVNHRERTSYGGRRMVSPDNISFFDAESEFGTSRPELDVFGSRLHRHVRHRSPEGFAEIVMLQSSLLMGGRSDGLDRYRDLRLDVDSMSYEELLDLGDRIGYVSTGLREDDIIRSLRKTKLSTVDELSSDLSEERKCSICQEEYEGDDEMGKLDCGHLYHMECIKNWLVQKNACPICKTAVASQQ